MASSNPFVSKGGPTFTNEIPSAIDTRQVQWQLYKKQQLTDLILITRSQEYKVHRVVIVALCSFLLPILTDNPSLSSLGLTINDEMMHFLLEFVYLGRVEVPQEFASVLGDAAKKLGIKQLANDCRRVMLSDCVPSVSYCMRGWASANHINDQMPIHTYKYASNVRNAQIASVPPQQVQIFAAQAEHIQGQKPLTVYMLAAAPPQDQKQMLGERLFPLIQTMHPELAGKITGMLLEIDNSELLHMLESRESLKAKVEEAVAVLQAHQAKEAAGIPVLPGFVKTSE